MFKPLFTLLLLSVLRLASLRRHSCLKQSMPIQVARSGLPRHLKVARNDSGITTLLWCINILVAPLLPSFAFASPGAWLQPEGRGQLIVNSLAYGSSERFDVNANRVNSASYSKYELNPYVEYGYSDTLTLGANAFLQRVDSTGEANYGIAEAELFARAPFLTFEQGVVTLQPMVKIPGWRSDDTPALGSKHPDVGISLISGMNFSLLNLPMFTESETSIRYRFGDAGNQYRANASLGVHATKDVLVLAQGFSTWRSVSMNRAAFTQSSADDYDLVKLQLSGVYRYTDTLSFQVGAFADVYGKNTGAGQGALFSVWRTF
jgi:protein XagA